MYILEAHPSDVWQMQSNLKDNVVFASPKNEEERAFVAGACVRKLGIKFPAVLDGFENTTEKAYTGWPDRLYLIGRDGKVAYKSAPGPFGFHPDDLKAALDKVATAKVLPAAAATPSAPGYKVVNTWKLGGNGGWDYITVDADGRRVFIARSDRVMVVDEDSGKLITEIPNTPGVHGVALTPEFGRGFISAGGEDMVTIFDLKSLKPLNKIKVGTRPDAIVYEPFTKRVFTFNSTSKDTTAVDADKGEVVGTIPLGGKPEFAASDEQGTMFVNIEDTSEIVVFDPQKLVVKSRWKLTGCEEPTGLAIDRKNRRLFAGCGGNKKMAIVDADSGKIIAMPDIGEGCDATAFDPDQMLAFASAGDGTITVIREESPDKFSVVETIKTQDRARTMAVDSKTHELFTVTATVLPERKVVPDTFVVLKIGK